jgi:hypothetical protein
MREDLKRQMSSIYRSGLMLLLLTGCAAEPGRVPGPGALVAGVGSRLVSAHDAIARSILGDAAKPMLIAPPQPTSAEADSVGALPAAATVVSRQAASAETSWMRPAEATSPDLDGDGVISVDEIVALGRSGLGDGELAERLERTGRTFDLSTSQEQYLRVRGISDNLIDRMRTLNRSAAPSPSDVAAVRVGDASGSR